MKVVVSSAGRFWSFHLAEQLEKHKALKYLVTHDFTRSTDRIPRKKIKGLLRLKLLRFVEMARVIFPFISKYTGNLFEYKFSKHDTYVSKLLMKSSNIDVFVGWSGSSIKSLSVADKKGITTIIESGSTHPLFHFNILKEEYKKVLGTEMKTSDKQKKQIKIALKELELCDYIAIPSKFVKKSYIEYGVPERKLIVVPYGVDLSNFRKGKKQDKKFRVIWCGTLCIRKGLHYLLQAFYELDLPDSELVLIGGIDQDMKYFLDKYKKHNIKPIGPKPQNQLSKYYSQGSIFVHPSIEEGLSLVQLEAMACGLPIICTTNTGGEDIIREGREGFIITIRDVQALKQKIKFFYDNPKMLKKMSINAAERVKDFTWDVYGNKIMKIYRKLTNNKI